MNYKIIIENSEEEQGKIDFKKLSLIAENILQVSYGAMQIRLTGVSFTKGRKPEILKDAVEIKLSGIERGSTILNIESTRFEKSLYNIQLNFFNQINFDNLLKQTPVSLYIDSFNEALSENTSSEHFDIPLINKLLKIKNIFNSEKEKLVFYNEDPKPKLTLTKKDFKKISYLEKSTPNPQKIIINGRVETMEYSKKRVKIITNNGQVEAYLTKEFQINEIKERWGQIVTISGTAHFRYGGKISFIEINDIYLPKESDSYFSKFIAKETSQQQLNNQLKKKGFKNNLKDIVGKFQTDDDFMESLKILSNE